MPNLNIEDLIQNPDKAAQVVRILLASKRMSQIELAERTGIARSYINGFLQRHVNLLSEDLEKALKVLGLNNSPPPNNDTLSISI